ncbi:glutathione S-transferase family protein [uncultured Phenylobacterium sp.]|uniref:glutathione S-transferase family protein n=1 Tax=uncultured Phenylobacterium sp. TaxID=349273 RepID=UPI0025FDE439|nr:glutathione S-transferase family protein [uncultured Phenylobacterium sp.]
MLRLYDHPFSPYAQKVKISLREKGQEFEIPLPEGIGAGGARGEFVEANPRAEVPALIDGDVKIFDSTIILEYIEDKWPTPPMLPKSPAERARVRMLEEVMDTHYEAINWGLGEIRSFKRATGDLAKKIEARAAEQTQGYFRWLEKQLGDRTWFNGDYFGWGDLAVIPYLNGSRGHGHHVPEGTKLAAWMQRANERPSVAATTKDITDMLSSGAPGMGDVAEMVEKGLFKREYRDHRLEWMIKVGGMEVILKGLERDNIRFGPEFG